MTYALHMSIPISTPRTLKRLGVLHGHLHFRRRRHPQASKCFPEPRPAILRPPAIRIDAAGGRLQSTDLHSPFLALDSTAALTTSTMCRPSATPGSIDGPPSTGEDDRMALAKSR